MVSTAITRRPLTFPLRSCRSRNRSNNPRSSPDGVAGPLRHHARCSLSARFDDRGAVARHDRQAGCRRHNRAGSTCLGLWLRQGHRRVPNIRKVHLHADRGRFRARLRLRLTEADTRQKRIPGIWGYGFAYLGWMRSLIPGAPMPSDARKAFTDNRIGECWAPELVAGNRPPVSRLHAGVTNTGPIQLARHQGFRPITAPFAPAASNQTVRTSRKPRSPSHALYSAGV